MRKVFSVLTLVTLLASVSLVVSADAPAPGGPFNTAFRVQNLSDQEAHCVYSFYNASGTAVFSSASESIAVGDSLYVYTPDLTGLDDGEYSGVVSCDVEVAAVANFSDPDSGASYSGVGQAEVGDTWYAPGVYNNYYNFYSNLYVQNASSGLVDITVEIYEPGNPTAVATQNEDGVPANASVSFEQENLSGLVTNQTYSAKVTAVEAGTSNPADVAAIVNIYGRSGANNQLYSYNPFVEGSMTAYAPVIMANYFGYNTALVVQNMGGSEANVKVTYTVPGMADVVKNHSISSGAAASLYTPAQGLGSVANKLMAAKVESSQPVAVIVNESTPTTNRAASYSGFAAGSQTVSAPIVMKRYYGYNTSVTCQNIGGGPSTNLSIAYAGYSGTTDYSDVGDGESVLLYQPTDSIIPDGHIGSATITSSAADIVCVVNEDQNEAPQSGQVFDQLYAYNGIPQ
jgi:hypothetical protein